ncbi:MAG: SH3 domain-containing protein [bacterium]|nr:SH3 domain-containing protein [bacterium]
MESNLFLCHTDGVMPQKKRETKKEATAGDSDVSRSAQSIHRRAVFSRVVIERPATHCVEETSVNNENPEELAVSHTHIIPLSQKKDLMRTVFFVLLSCAIVYAAYITVAYGIARTTLVYEYQGDFFTNKVIQADDALSGPTVEILDTSTGFLRVRRGPSTSYDEIAQVQPGATYRLLETRGQWYNIQLDETATGWIFAEYANVLSN